MYVTLQGAAWTKTLTIFRPYCKINVRNYSEVKRGICKSFNTSLPVRIQCLKIISTFNTFSCKKIRTKFIRWLHLNFCSQSWQKFLFIDLNCYPVIKVLAENYFSWWNISELRKGFGSSTLGNACACSSQSEAELRDPSTEEATFKNQLHMFHALPSNKYDPHMTRPFSRQLSFILHIINRNPFPRVSTSPEITSWIAKILL